MNDFAALILNPHRASPVSSRRDSVGDESGESMGETLGEQMGAIVSGIMTGGISTGAQHRDHGKHGKKGKKHFQGKQIGYEPFKPTAWRIVPIGGLVIPSLAAGATDSATNRPQIPFEPKRLFLPSTVGVDIDVADFLIGNQSQFAAKGAVPGLVFAENSMEVGIRGDTAYQSMDVVVEYLNNAGVAKRCSSAVLGYAVKGNLAGRPKVAGFYPTIVLPHFSAEDAPGLSSDSLVVLLRALTDLNVLWLRANPHAPMLYESGVRYVRDEKGKEDWRTIPDLYERRRGDCKSLACARAAELLFRGVPAFPQFKWIDRPEGGLYHIQVQHLQTGEIEDPSAILGMRRIS